MGGFVDDEVGGPREVYGVRPLGAEFLVDEGREVAELLEDGGHGRGFGNGGLSLDADLVAGRCRRGLRGGACA